MAKFGKKYRAILKDAPKQPVSIEEAIKFIKAHPAAKFDETLDVAFCLGTNCVRSDSPVRGTVKLPAGSGKNVKVLVFAGGEHADQAKAAGADYVGAEDMPVKQARKIIGNNKILGATAKTVEAALKAYGDGADYLGVGAIYPTTTKVKTVLTSTETLDAITKAVPIPVNAIGGLNSTNLGVLKGIDIAGICAVSAIMKADDPKRAAEELRDAFADLRRSR